MGDAKARSKRADAGLDFRKARELLDRAWQEVSESASNNPGIAYIDNAGLIDLIRSSINHNQVSYRFCLPIQLLGKVTDPALDALRLQKRKGDNSDVTGWDARSLGKHVVAIFNREQESILGSSGDPYVGNPMRIPRMFKDDSSKKDIPGWNKLVEVLETVQQRNEQAFTSAVFRQVLVEMFRRQQTLKFAYPTPPRVSLEQVLEISENFLLHEKSGGDRALALSGALFDAIGEHFKLFCSVNRARINASDEATGLAADLECLDQAGNVVLAVEVKDRVLTLTDIEDTLRKTRQRSVRDVLFAVTGIAESEKTSIAERVNRAFASGQNLYIFELFALARSVLALGGEKIRKFYLEKVGQHLDTWNTQPRHRRAWKDLLSKL